MALFCCKSCDFFGSAFQNKLPAVLPRAASREFTVRCGAGQLP
jgi:hypothetical protein